MISLVSWFFAFFSVFIFFTTLKLLSAQRQVRQITAEAKNAREVIFNKRLSDLEKEKAVQASALKLFLGFLGLCKALSLAIFLPSTLLFLAFYFDILSVNEFLKVSLSWPFLILSSLFGLFWFYVEHSWHRV